jgi:VIT1/CCC1 family predicted Fe2+/Mn2+ transporter
MAVEVAEDIPPYEDHLSHRAQYLRDAMLGVNDGLVSMFLLVVGVVGGGVGSDVVLLAGLAGAFAGAVSMASGEYIATKSQDEAIEGEIELERVHFKYYRDKELDELREMMAEIGLSDDAVAAVVASADADDDVLMELMKVFEFGIHDLTRRNPFLAMAASGLLFLLGSVPAVLPFALLNDPHEGLAVAAFGALISLFVVGVLKTKVTRGRPLVSGFENVAVAGVGAAISYLIGSAYESFIA